MNKVELQVAYVIHRRHYRNTSAIVEFFTRDYGRLAVLAKGVRRNKSPFAAILQAFQPLLISWGGRGDLPVLYNAENHGNAFQFVGPTLYSGFYINELIMKFLHSHDPHADLFEAYHGTLLGFAEAENLQVCLRRFERCLLDEIGYGLQLDSDSEGRPIDPQADYLYVMEQGPLAVAEVPANSNNLVLKGSSLLALESGRFSTPEQMRQAKLLMRKVIDYYLGHKSLNSRDLFESHPT